MKLTFFVGSVVGYVDNPTAIYTRGLAHGLSLRGNDVRIVEERQNAAVTRTLQTAGASAARHFYDHFRTIQHHTYEPRSGSQLLEWVTREIALADAAIAVCGVETELCRWLANLTREGLVRGYLSFEPEALTDNEVARLELTKFDLVLTPYRPAATIAWTPVELAVSGDDSALIDAAKIARSLAEDADPIRAAELFEAAMALTAPTRR